MGSTGNNVPMEITRHFTATTFVVRGGKVLLHLHRRLGKWLPVGGHIDRDELPHEAALREVKEESGLDVVLYSSGEPLRCKDVRELVPPAHLLLEDINPFHQHIDFVYYAYGSTFEIDPTAEEAETLRWFELHELAGVPDMPEDVVNLAREAVALLSRE